jgi:hypothetical protein
VAAVKDANRVYGASRWLVTGTPLPLELDKHGRVAAVAAAATAAARDADAPQESLQPLLAAKAAALERALLLFKLLGNLHYWGPDLPRSQERRFAQLVAASLAASSRSEKDFRRRCKRLDSNMSTLHRCARVLACVLACVCVCVCVSVAVRWCLLRGVREPGGHMHFPSQGYCCCCCCCCCCACVAAPRFLEPVCPEEGSRKEAADLLLTDLEVSLFGDLRAVLAELSKDAYAARGTVPLPQVPALWCACAAYCCVRAGCAAGACVCGCVHA